MSYVPVKTTYGEADMNRLNKPSQKICGFYEQKGSFQPVFDQSLDSGISDAGFDSGPPVQPKLLGGAAIDHENYDSGAYMDDEPDRVNTIKEEIPQTHTPLQKLETLTIKNTTIAQNQPPTVPAVVNNTPVQKPPRRPRTNYSVMATASNSNITVPTTVQAGRPTTSHNVTSSRNNTSIQSTRIPQAPISLPAQRRREFDHNVRRRNERNQPSSLPGSINTFAPSTSSRNWPEINIFELQQNVQFFLPNREGDTGFHLAVIHNLDDLMDKLLYIMSREPRLQSVVDEQNTLYQTALHLATHTQQTEMIRKLLIAGASLNITDHKGNTPLHIAAQFNSTKALEEILRYVSLRAVLEVSQIRNNEGQTCVHIAAKHGNTDALRKLKSLGVDMDMQEHTCGRTPLHLVVENNSLSSVQFLLETCDADVNATTYSGCTPLHIASGRGSIDIVAYLISMGADPTLKTDEEDTALELAGSEAVTILLNKAAALRWL